MMLRRILDLFTDWFCSGAGVWQTTFVTLGIVAVELSDRTLDPHAFVLMAVLTVYSAITQPALAHSGAVSGERLEALEQQNCALLTHLESLLEGQAKIHEAVKA